MQMWEVEAEAALSEVQGNWKNNRVRSVRGNGMERDNEQEMRTMRGDGLPVKPEYKPSFFRFYTGAIAVGITVGMTWFYALQLWMTRPHAARTMLSIVAVIFAWQTIHLWRENKRLKLVQAALDKDWDALMHKYPEIKDLEQYKVMEERKR